MDSLSLLTQGFEVALTPSNILFCIIGVVLGTLIGVLPGIGTSNTLALLLPVTFALDPTASLIMFAGIYCGAQYGGSTTSILINTPGESSSVVTVLDGHQMAKNGRAGAALGIAAISSFIGGTVGLIGLTFLAPPIASVALSFGSPEYFLLMLSAFVILALLGSGGFIKSLGAIAIGLMLGTIGLDTSAGRERFTFGLYQLLDGVDFIVFAMGLFAVAEVFTNVEKGLRIDAAMLKVKLRTLWPTAADLWACRWTFPRCTLVGFLIGVLPGTGTVAASFAGYAIERQAAKNPDKFGSGVVEGVAAPEGANNAAVTGALVPMLTLGIPGSGSTAIMLAFLMLNGIRPGPLLYEQHPGLVWGVVASMYIGNVLLLALNLPMVPLFASLMRIPYTFMYPFILLVAVVGAYSLNNDFFEVWMLLFVGVVGYGLRKLQVPFAPLVLAIVLGPMAERAFVQSLSISRGDPSIFITRPISGTMVAIMVAGLLISIGVRLHHHRASHGTKGEMLQY